MKHAFRRVGVASMAAALLAASTLAVAQPRYSHGDRDDRPDRRQGQSAPPPSARQHSAPPSRGPAQAGPGQWRHQPAPQARGPQFHGQRGAGPDHDWYRGARIPPQYRSHHYVVNDWRYHHLTPPPRGYHWVQYGSDYLLVAITTGVILQIILSN